MPPLERMLAYVAELDRLRKRRDSVPGAEFVGAFEELTPKEVRGDFAEMGIELRGNAAINLHAVYWEVFDRAAKVQQEVLRDIAPQLQLPSHDDVLAALKRGPRAERASGSGVSPLLAARMADLAYDVAVEKGALFMLGHGAMPAGRMAYRHQLASARRVLDEMHGVAIVADEVGLGKTIVAGLLLEELLAENPEATALILVPPNLRRQWAEDELPAFFRRLVPWELRGLSLKDIANARVLLLSLDQAKGDGKGDALSTALRLRSWDLLIVDEAHDCRNTDSLRFRFVYSLRARQRVFLTATPLHNSGYDIFALATLLKPGSLGTRRSFAERFMAGERLLKENSALHDSIQPMMVRTLRAGSGLPFGKRRLTSVTIEQFKKEEEKLYNSLLGLLRTIYQRHMGGATEIKRPSAKPQHVSQFVLIAMLVLREMASHPLAAIQTLKTALRKRVKELADVSRDYSDLERLDEFIKSYTDQPWDVTHHAKSERLVQEADKLFAADKKFIVYVNYLKTHQLLVKLLSKRHPDRKVVSYEGTLPQSEKEDALKLFGESPRSCLVSTDAGGQGLNLQMADCVVNYDFPWNPMRVEQRVGRVDRIGHVDRATQKAREVRVLNFRTLGTVEEYVQIVLTSKLKEVTRVLGEFTSPLQVEKIYEDKLTMGIGRALMESRDVDEMRKRMKRLGEDDFRRYVGDFTQYEKQAPADWTWQPRD
jgi:SNF2 family DNA or RNA helicase